MRSRLGVGGDLPAHPSLVAIWEAKEAFSPP
jgi:hypothetical protein